MPFLSILTSKYTWMALGGLAVGIWAYFGVYLPYEHMKAQAALVPGLESSLAGYKNLAASNEARAAQISFDLTVAAAQRDQAEKDLVDWQGLKSQLSTSLTEMSKHASATVNAVCLPSADERELWNSTLAKLTAANAGAGSAPAPGGVPADTGGIH